MEEMDVQKETLSLLNKSGSRILSNSSLTAHDRDAHVNKLRQINISWSQVCPSVSLSVFFFISPSVCPSCRLPVFLAVCLSAYLSSFLFVYLAVCVIQLNGRKFNAHQISSSK